MTKSISNDCDGPCGRSDTIDLVWQTGIGTKVLKVAVQGIGEVQILVVWIDGDIVE
jgi:hypothetical protein